MTLLQMSMSAAILIVVITVLRAVSIHKLPKKTFLFLWGVALFRLLLPISVPSIFSIYSWIPQSRPHVSEPVDHLPRLFVTPDRGIENIATKLEPQGFFSVSISWWAVLWITGFLACVVYFVMTYHRGMKKFKHALPMETLFIKEWKEKHPLKRTLSIHSSDQVFTPLSYGIGRPVILLPGNLDFDNTKALNYILTHEYVHIRHFDVLTKMLMILALSIHWFNPMVWVMFLLLNRDIELVCDETVLKLFGEKSKGPYAHILLDMEIQKSGLMPLCNNFSKNATHERIGAIMKMKKMTLFSFIFAMVLIAGVTMAFATSGIAGKEKNQFIGSNLTAEEFEQISALKFSGYEEMSISEYQDKVWTITDTEEYIKLLERAFNDNTLYEQKDSDAAASFLFNVLEPLTSERWQEREFGGYVQTSFKEASDNTLLEYSFTMAIKNPQALTVGEYDKTRLSIKTEFDELMNNKTSEQLEDQSAMNSHIRSEIENMEKRYNSDKLKIDFNYIYQPLSGLEADNAIEAAVEGQEEREYPNATGEDYQSLLALKTPNYQMLPVSDFNRNLLEWANEDYSRSERIAVDRTRNDYEISLSKEEKNFIEFTVWASGIENAEFVRSHYTSEPMQDPVLSIDLPDKEDYSDGEVSAWCVASYQLSYHIEKRDVLSVGERDLYLGNVLSEIQSFWDDAEIPGIINMGKKEMEKKFSEIAIKNSNEKMTFSIVEGQVYFEHDNP